MSFTQNNVTYTISGSNVSVTGFSTNPPLPANWNLTIPSTVTNGLSTYNVTSIGNRAFQSCSNLTSIIIPNSVTSLGDAAFLSCSKLSIIIIPNSVTSLGTGVFYSCTALTSATISNSVTSLSDYMFWSCSNLTSIIIPDSVTSIGDDAFYGCSSLTGIIIPNSVTSINSSTFQNCSSLTSATIGSSITNINVYTFLNCTSLTSIIIPISVTNLGTMAFYGCTLLTSVQIDNPEGITTIGTTIFNAINVSPTKTVLFYLTANYSQLTTNGKAIAEYFNNIIYSIPTPTPIIHLTPPIRLTHNVKKLSGKISNNAINIGCTKGIGSSTRVVNYCKNNNCVVFL